MMDTLCRQQKGAQVGWEEFLPHVLPYVFGAPEELAIDAIRAAAIEFCKLTNALRRLFVADLFATVENYPIEQPDDGYQIGVLLRTVVDGAEYRPLPSYPAGGRGRGVYFDRPRMVYLFPPPYRDVPDGLELEISLYPSQSSCEIDQQFFEDHADAVALGAVSRLLLIPNMAWSDRAMSNTFHRRFKDAINLTKVRLSKGNQAGPLIAKAGRRWY